jgi:hypothetical protein
MGEDHKPPDLEAVLANWLRGRDVVRVEQFFADNSQFIDSPESRRVVAQLLKNASFTRAFVRRSLLDGQKSCAG